MSAPQLRFDTPGPKIIGMVHLLPLPGSPRYGGRIGPVRDAALRDAEALEQGGVDAVLVENFFDAPFFPAAVPAETIAAMTSVAAAVVASVSLPVGVNVLRNDGAAALAVAAAVEASFLRVNVLIGARLTDQGIVHGIAHELLRRRRLLAAESVLLLADVAVKHSAPLAEYDLVQEVQDTVVRGGADAVVVTGTGTGKPVDPSRITRVRDAAAPTPVLIGSGVNEQSIQQLAQLADGLIVGTALKRHGSVNQPVDPERVRRLVSRLPG